MEILSNTFNITAIGQNINCPYEFKLKKDNSEYIFAYCTKGSGLLEFKNQKMIILPNQFFIIPKNKNNGFGSYKNLNWSVYWMHFNGEIADNLFQKYYHREQIIQDAQIITERMDLFDKILRIHENEPNTTNKEYANILALKFLASFVFRDNEQLDKTSNLEDLVDSIIDFLVCNVDKSFNSEDIVKEFNYSSSYIFKLFKKKTGYPLYHFFNLKKMQKASEYLYTSDLTIKEICYKLGFQDPQYFSRIFKKFMGVSPREYKKRQKR